MAEAERCGVGAKWAIRQALATAVERAAEHLESADVEGGRRKYNAHIDWPEIYTFEPEEGPAAFRAVARELRQPSAVAELEAMAADFDALDNAAARRGEVDALEIDGLQRASRALRERAAEIRRRGGDG